LQVIELGLAGVKLITPKRHGDHRGFFSETYSRRSFSEIGIAQEFVQDNHSLSADVGTLRGLHFQLPPFAQDKLIRVCRGRILDVVVDIRKDSPTFGQSLSMELTAQDWNQLFVPIGFAHGFCTLEPDTEVIYKVSNFYSPEHDRGLLWNDPDLGIAWPVTADQAILSPKDKTHPRLKDLKDLF